ncbi:hypothetical protein [Haemophilus paraphrohaemolyticus]|uniref:hypothetical protein n=1 Tax=Haemophilus paraphrohaemolyticus TaxID=736 RepID=UPI0028E379BE|nr:hypothetical protein [Haemophilus paraphrohaemolyticus]
MTHRSSLIAHRSSLIASLVLGLLTGCQVLNDGLSQVNQTLQTVNDTLAGTTISSSTKSSIASALNKATLPQNVKALFNDAKPTLEKVLTLIACEKDDQVKAYTDESSVGMSYPLNPVRQMSYNKSNCVNVQRIDGIQLKSANTFIFRTVFVSPTSQETYIGRYLAIKQPDGAWLFNWSTIGM